MGLFRKPEVLLLVAFCICLLSSGFPAPARARASTKGDEQILLSLANQARANQGAPPLQMNEELSKAALQHSQRMNAREQLSHQFPGEPGLQERLASQSRLHLEAIAENVGVAETATGVHTGFMHSPPHRENLLNPAYNVVGIGVVHRGPLLYVTEDFGQSLPNYSHQQAENAIESAIEQERKNLQFPPLQLRENSAAQKEACAMAQSNSIKGQAKASGARYIIRFTTMMPGNLPPAASQALRDRTLQSFELGTCFARSKSYPSGTYWVVLSLY